MFREPSFGSEPQGSKGVALGGVTGSTGEKGKRTMNAQMLMIILFGVIVGIAASFSGLGGGFLMVPLLLFWGYSAQKAVGSTFLAIVIISLSALVAHNKLANVDYKVGLLLGLGGIIGAQVGARLLEHVATLHFKRIFAVIILGMALYLFFKK